MDSFELNKIIAAVLMVALLIIGIGKLTDVIFHVEKPERPGYVVEIKEVAETAVTTTGVAEEKVDIGALMAMIVVAFYCFTYQFSYVFVVELILVQKRFQVLPNSLDVLFLHLHSFLLFIFLFKRFFLVSFFRFLF